MVKVTNLLINAGSGLGFSFKARARTEMGTWWVKGTCMLNVASVKKNQVLKDSNRS